MTPDRALLALAALLAVTGVTAIATAIRWSREVGK